MAKVLERVRAHYEVQEVDFGRVYKWCPENVLIECECGEITSLTTSTATCEKCAADHTSVVQEELAGQYLEDETLHPWRYWRTSGNAGLPI